MKRIPPYAVLAVNALACLGGTGCGATPTGVTTEPIEEVDGSAIYVVNGRDATVSVLAADSFGVLGTIALGGVAFPHHINLSPDGTKITVAAPGVDLSGGHAGHGGAVAMRPAVLVMEATTGRLQVSRILDDVAHNAAFSPDGTEIWAAQMRPAGTVLILDSSTLEEKAVIQVESEPAEVTFSPNGAYAFIANGGSDSISVVDTATKTIVSTVPVGSNPVGAWRGSDAMYVDNEAGQSITAIDPATHEVLRTYQLGFTPAMATSNDTGNLWVTDTTNGQVVIFEVGTTTRIGVIATGAGAHAVAMIDSGIAVVSNQNAHTVSIVDAISRAVVRSVGVGGKPNGVAYRRR